MPSGFEIGILELRNQSAAASWWTGTQRCSRHTYFGNDVSLHQSGTPPWSLTRRTGRSNFPASCPSISQVDVKTTCAGGVNGQE